MKYINCFGNVFMGKIYFLMLMLILFSSVVRGATKSPQEHQIFFSKVSILNGEPYLDLSVTQFYPDGEYPDLNMNYNQIQEILSNNKEVRKLRDDILYSYIIVGIPLWVYNRGKVTKYICNKIILPKFPFDKHSPFGRIKLILKEIDEFDIISPPKPQSSHPADRIPTSYVSLISAPKSQGWELIPVSGDDFNMALKDAEKEYKTNCGRDVSLSEFLKTIKIKAKNKFVLIAQYERCVESEWSPVQRLIYFKEGLSNWSMTTSMRGYEFMPIPFYDIDGDGIPEVIGFYGYRGRAAWKIYPNVILLGASY
jgi:hypothetical protein